MDDSAGTESPHRAFRVPLWLMFLLLAAAALITFYVITRPVTPWYPLPDGSRIRVVKVDYTKKLRYYGSTPREVLGALLPDKIADYLKLPKYDKGLDEPPAPCIRVVIMHEGGPEIYLRPELVDEDGYMDWTSGEYREISPTKRLVFVDYAGVYPRTSRDLTVRVVGAKDRLLARIPIPNPGYQPRRPRPTDVSEQRVVTTGTLEVRLTRLISGRGKAAWDRMKTAVAPKTAGPRTQWSEGPQFDEDMWTIAEVDVLQHTRLASYNVSLRNISNAWGDRLPFISNRVQSDTAFIRLGGALKPPDGQYTLQAELFANANHDKEREWTVDVPVLTTGTAALDTRTTTLQGVRVELLGAWPPGKFVRQGWSFQSTTPTVQLSLSGPKFDDARLLLTGAVDNAGRSLLPDPEAIPQGWVHGITNRWPQPPVRYYKFPLERPEASATSCGSESQTTATLTFAVVPVHRVEFVAEPEWFGD